VPTPATWHVLLTFASVRPILRVTLTMGRATTSRARGARMDGGDLVVLLVLCVTNNAWPPAIARPTRPAILQMGLATTFRALGVRMDGGELVERAVLVSCVIKLV